MPSPYTIDQAAQASGLSVKFIRRMKEALPTLFEKHTERGAANALLFDETILEILKQTRELRSRGRTLQQIRDELAALSGKTGQAESGGGEGHGGKGGPSFAKATVGRQESIVGKEGHTVDSRIDVTNLSFPMNDTARIALERENALLRSQMTLLQTLLQKAEERFDRLLPARTKTAEEHATTEKPQTLQSQLLLWLVEAVVVTAFASGFIFLIWFFAQKTFSI